MRRSSLLFWFATCLSCSIWAQNTPNATAASAVVPDTSQNDEITLLRQEIAAQQRQIQHQQDEINELRSEIAPSRTQPTRADDGPSPAEVPSQALTGPLVLAARTSLVSATSASTSEPGPGASVSALQQQSEPVSQESPLSFRIGSADFTPGGFMDLTSIFRTTNVGSGIGTSFGSIPYNNTFPQAALSESRFSAQNSRLSLKVNAKVGATDVTAYVESDFLGFQPPNANQTSNSDSFRLRLYFADLKRGKFEVQGGQLWTWMTPNRVGLSPMPSDIFHTQNMDTNYQVGLTWARQTAFRVAYHPTDWWGFGVSIENPEQFAPSSVALPNSTFASQFDNGSGSTSASSSGTNPATPNLHPDVIVKTAFDWKLGGKAMHVEAAGLGRSFKVYNGLVTPGTTDTIHSGAGSVNVNLELIKNLHVIGNSFYGCGGGRYIFGLGPDVIVTGDGHLSCVHSGSGIGGFEWQTTPKFMVYGYYGSAYYQRNFDFISAGSGSTPNGVPCIAANPPAGFNCVGFGFPGSSNSANRAIQEGTIGFIPTLWTSPKYGKLQLITQYSYVTRAPWFIVAPSPKNAHTNLVYVDLRYALP